MLNWRKFSNLQVFKRLKLEKNTVVEMGKGSRFDVTTSDGLAKSISADEFVNGLDSLGYELLTAATTLTAADHNKVFLLGAAAGFTVTLPALSPGLRFRFEIVTAPTGGNYIIDSAEGDNINGSLIVAGAQVTALAEDQINLTQSLAVRGDWVELICTGFSWGVSGMGAATSSITATDPS